MKDSIKEMFAQIRMPEDCEKNIRQAAEHAARSAKRPVFRPATVLAVLMAVVLVAAGASNNVVRAAVQETVDKVIRYVFTSGSEADTPHNDRVEVVDGRIYLWTLDETIDITDKFSMETPYIHIYTDVGGKEQILIIGGTPDKMGYCNFTRILQEDGTMQWLGGASGGHLDQEGNLYPWAKAAWEELDIPWC